MFRPEFQHLSHIERKRITMPANTRLRLNRLERPQPWPHGFLERLRHTLDLEKIQQYPDYPPFYEAVAAFNGAKADEIVVGAGIEEFIRTLMFLCAGPGEKVAVLWPTCAMFEIYARAFNIELVKIIPDPQTGISVSSIVEQLPADVRLFIMANPGQPVETMFGWGSLQPLARILEDRGAVFAVDEAYHGFGASTIVGCHDWHANTVALRTFSKAFGAAGIRLGYAIGAPGVIAALNAVRQSGEVSAISMAIATELMKNFDEIVKPGIEEVIAGRDMLRDRVAKELGFPTHGFFANHVLIDFLNPARAEQVANKLWQRGALVKAGYPSPVDRHVLVTCGGPSIMADFFEELKGAI